ncbi:hypothetical protein [Variovorax sp. DT-64]|uniref:hypothetical protein n=1 Tax=Variovorax sp. DT-64 TaxID=3396160 RepID=UPI003F1BFCBF
MSNITEEKPRDLLTLSGGLSHEALQALTRREALIVRIPGFISAGVCHLIARGLLRHGYDDYLNAPAVGRIGMSFFETGGNREVIDQYFATALPNIRLLRNACAPYQCPIDVFRCVVDELWPSGASLQSLSGARCSSVCHATCGPAHRCWRTTTSSRGWHPMPPRPTTC